MLPPGDGAVIGPFLFKISEVKGEFRLQIPDRFNGIQVHLTGLSPSFPMNPLSFATSQALHPFWVMVTRFVFVPSARSAG